MIKTVEMEFEFMNIIPAPPRTSAEMYQQACSNDKVTLDSWRDIWIKHAKENHKNYGPFSENSAGSLYDKFRHKPVIVAGAGPSIKNNVSDLKDTKGIPIISCLHNFHFMVDNEIKNIEGFVSLDAGDVVIKEISEGPIKFFNCPVPDPQVTAEFKAIEEFNCYVSSGGNVLGACAYMAKAWAGANPICFVGADFAFSYTKKFHGWDSSYDKDIGNCLRATDIYGHKVLTWQSYFNFSQFFAWLACNVPGLYINCTEGGIMGAYPEGNIHQIMQMDLKKLIRMYSINEDMKSQCMEPQLPDNRILY